MEVRPRVASGLLLHVPSEQGHFTVFIRGGEVRLDLTLRPAPEILTSCCHGWSAIT